MKRPSSSTDQQGYTLIELLLYVAIVSILLTSITYFFGTITEARIKSQTISEVDTQGAAAMNYILQTIRNASSVTSPATGASGASLTLVMPTGSLSPTIFSLNGTTLQVQEGAAVPVPLTSDDVQITSLSFKNLTNTGAPGIVQVSFIMNRVNPSNQNPYDYQKTFTASAELTW